MLNDLECGIVARGGGNGGGTAVIELEPVERFRRGNGSEFPSYSLSRLVNVVFGDVAKFDIEFVSNENVPLDVEPKRRLRVDVLVEPFRVDTGN